MSAKQGTGYILGFAVAVCLFCSVFVCLAAVGLKDMQDANEKLDMQKNVLMAAGLAKPGEDLPKEKIDKLYENVEQVFIDLESGKPAEDQGAASKEPGEHKVEANDAKLLKVPNAVEIFKVMEDGKPSMLVLPIEGKGLWGTMYGYLAVDKDTTTVRGVSFYKHQETPGLGGEIQNPAWTALWNGRKLLNENWEPAFEVIKGQAGSAEEDPSKVDGISGATLTGRGVTGTVRFWVGDQGFGPYLKNFREGGV